MLLLSQCISCTALNLICYPIPSNINKAKTGGKALRYRKKETLTSNMPMTLFRVGGKLFTEGAEAQTGRGCPIPAGALDSAPIAVNGDKGRDVADELKRTLNI